MSGPRTLPVTSEPLRMLAEFLRRLGERDEVRVQGYDAAVDGSVTVDVRIRVGETDPGGELP